MTASVSPDANAPAPTIPKEGPAELGLDQRRLHSLGLDYARRLSRRIWSDYNTHDPGYTALELASYALTDLTSRAEWPVEDQLAGAAGGGPAPAPPLFSARTILPARPLTTLDYRKLLIDLKDVKNAWVLRAEERWFVDPSNGELFREAPPRPGIREINLRGLYRVLLEYMEGVDDAAKAAAIQAAKRRLHEHRNLCEDFVSVDAVTPEPFRLCGEILIAPEADAAAVKAEVLFRVQRYLAPPVWNYKLGEMLERTHPNGDRYTVQEIFDGPALDTGFYDDDEVEAADLRTEIRLSDVIALAMKVPGVRAVRELLVSPTASSGPVEQKWTVPVTEGRQATLDRLGSRLVLYKGYLPIVPPDAPVEAAYDALVQAERGRLEGQIKGDLPIPAGRDRRPERYHPFQYHFPAVFNLGEHGPALEHLAPAERKRRRAQAYQLKGYLLFLDQLMANYCAQLSRVRQLFSADATLGRTYFAQAVAIVGADELYPGAGADPVPVLEGLLESPAQAAERRHVFLDHLIARFAERFHEYAATMYSLFGADHASLIEPKCLFLQDYPALSSERGLAYDYGRADAAALWDSDNTSGLERRVGRLLGLRDLRRRDLSEVVEDAASVVVPDGPEFVWQVRDRNDPAVVLLRSRGKFATAALAREALRDALRRGQQRASYEVKVAADGRHFFNLLGEAGGVLAMRFAASAAECDAMIRGLLRHFTYWYGEEGMYLVENILLRPGQPGDPSLPVCPEPNCTDCPGDDPYSYRVHVVLPAYAGRFATMAFRRFAEAVLRDETPAHVLPRICWIGREDMRRLERAYRDWLEIRSGASAVQRNEKVEALVKALYEAKNVYPAGRITACTRGEDPGRFILGRHALGTMPPRDD